jgi:hypothetical protein
MKISFLKNKKMSLICSYSFWIYCDSRTKKRLRPLKSLNSRLIEVAIRLWLQLLTFQDLEKIKKRLGSRGMTRPWLQRQEKKLGLIRIWNRFEP